MAAHPRYAPDFRIQINDQDVPQGLRASIQSVRFQEGWDASNRVEIGIANTNLRWLQTHIRGLGFQPFPTGVRIGPMNGPQAAPDGTFDIQNKVTLALGYAPDPLDPVFTGEITGVQASFPNGGMPAMTVVAQDYLNRLATGAYSRGFGFLPDFLIAAILSAENLLIPLVDPTVIGASTAIAVLNVLFTGTGRKQKGQTDLQVLEEIAATYDADFWVEGNVLYVSRFMKSYSPSVTLTYGESLLDFAPRVSTIGQVAGVSMRFVLREIPLDFLVTIFWDFDTERLGVSIVPGAAAASLKSLVGSVFEIIDQPINSPADIVNSALVITRELRNKLNKRLTGSGSSIGDTRIRAGAVLRLEGLGPDFSGDYRVSAATHTIDSGGYRTSFEVRKEILP